MSNLDSEGLQALFYPTSIALAGITVNNPKHWTRTFFDSLREFQFEGPLYLVNPKGGEINGIKVYRRFGDIPQNIDYVISTVPAKAAPGPRRITPRTTGIFRTAFIVLLPNVMHRTVRLTR